MCLGGACVVAPNSFSDLYVLLLAARILTGSVYMITHTTIAAQRRPRPRQWLDDVDGSVHTVKPAAAAVYVAATAHAL